MNEEGRKTQVGGSVKKALQPSPQAVHHFTHFDRVDQLAGASETDADLGFMARVMALCSLPPPTPTTGLGVSAPMGRRCCGHPSHFPQRFRLLG